MAYPLPANDPLGTDLRLDPSGDLVTTMSGSLDTVTHEENVSQSVRVNITTIPYTYLWGNDVGTYLASYVDAPITPAAKKEIEAIIQDRLQQDPRIIEIQGVDIDDTTLDGGLIITIRALVSSVGVVQIPVVVGGGGP